MRGERFAVRNPVGVKSDFFFVFIPIVRVNDIQISVENLFAAALSCGVISAERITFFYRGNATGRRECTAVIYSKRIADGFIPNQFDISYGCFPHRVKGDFAAVFRAKIKNGFTVVIHRIAVCAQRPTRKGMSFFRKSVFLQYAFHVESERIRSHRAETSESVIFNGIRIRFPDGVKNQVFVREGDGFASDKFRRRGGWLFSPSEEGITKPQRRIGRNGCRSISLINICVYGRAATAVCVVNNGKTRAVVGNDQNGSRTVYNKGIFARFARRKKFAVSVNLYATSRNGENRNVAELVTIV